jgi:hypothetical protein
VILHRSLIDPKNMNIPPGFSIVSAEKGYTILQNDKNLRAVLIDDKQFEIMLDHNVKRGEDGVSYRIIYHIETGERYIRTKDTFGAILEVTESLNGPVIKFKSIPDNYSGLLVGNKIAINPN